MSWFMENVHLVPFVIGVVLCVAGWTLYWGGLNLVGAIVGVAFGLAVGAAGLMFLAPPKEYGPWHLFVLPIAAVVGLYLGTRLFRQLHRLFFFFIGAVLGMLLWGTAEITLQRLDLAYLSAEVPWLVVGLIVALLCGIIMVVLSRYCIVIVTSFIGTVILFQSMPNTSVQLFAIPAFLTSVAIQTGFVRSLGLGVERKPEEEEEEEE